MDVQLCDRESQRSPREPSTDLNGPKAEIFLDLDLKNDISRLASDTSSNNPESEEGSVVTPASVAASTEGSNTDTSDYTRKNDNGHGEEVKSIYLDDGSHKKKPETVKPQRKLTKAQLAAMEALASFGGSDLGSVSVKRRDLRDELKRETEQLKSQDTVPEGSVKRPRTRLQAAKQETESIFKHIALGDGVKKTVPFKRKRVREGEEEGGVEMKRLSKLDKAKAEALVAFGRASFGSLSKKRRMDKDNNNNNIRGVKKQRDAQSRTGRLTRAERARLEALKSFGGSALGEVLDGSKKRIARTLEVKSKEEAQSETSDASKDDLLQQQQQDKENFVNQIAT